MNTKDTDWPADEPDAPKAEGVETSPVVLAQAEPRDLEAAPTLLQARAMAAVKAAQQAEEMNEGWGLTPDTTSAVPVNAGNAEKAPEPEPVKMTFGKAFAQARKDGVGTFEWRGKKYTTEMRGKAKPEAPAAAPARTEPQAEHGESKMAEAAKKPNFFPGNSPDAGKSIYAGAGIDRDKLGSSGKLAKGAGRVIGEQPAKRAM